MPTRNELLKSIVIASGGTITSNASNGLLQDWLDAVEPQSNGYVARLDGLTQYWQFSEPLDLLSGDEIHLSYTDIATDGSRSYFIGDDAYRFALISTADAIYFDGYSTNSTVNGNAIVNEVTEIPSTGVNDLVVTPTRSGSVIYIGAQPTGSGYKMNGALFNFSVIRNGAVINEIPLNNKYQGATQLPTIGGVSATMINYTEAVWQEL